ncbi:hypothetical protein FUAX_18080 [Fulvitalea axinellae]|uniref:Acetyl xylan esterase domain-containing protein n=1 Tax=Fulvitalea axinellae TaxID=1182444 RepID=A0AAU9CKA8_9BACT|nr:hypothetical protein FUAX_18080 [Fulvitalea axinellae]
MMIPKNFILSAIFIFAMSNGFAQNLIPFDWKLTFNDGLNKEKSMPFSMLLSWERQGLYYQKPSGVLQTSFFVPKQNPTDFNLEITLLASVDSVEINGHYIGGGFNTGFVWSISPVYKSKKFKVPSKYLKFNKENSIKIKCSNYSYTGGKNHNAVKLYRNVQPDSRIAISYKPENHVFENPANISLNINIKPKSRGQIDLLIKNDFHKTVVKRKIKTVKGKQSYELDLSSEKLKPGFYTVTAILKNDGYLGASSFFCVAPTKIEIAKNEPKGYFKYWQNAIEELKTVKPNFEIEKREDLCSENRNGYIVKMKSVGNVDIYGYYFVPKKKGSYPTILHLPGYGYGFEHLNGFLQSKNEIVELALCVRGHGLSKESFKTDFPVPGFFGHGICDIDKTAYRQIFMDCLRAVDFLGSRQEVDQSKIGVMGSSQGGGLALMTAGLLPDRISACAYGDPFPTDMRNHIQVRTLIKDEVRSFLDYYGNSCDFEAGLRTLDFLDTKHFAKRIKASTLYIAGLVDDDCPPRLGFSAFNEINSKKEYVVFPNDSHIGESNWSTEMMNFFKKEFKFQTTEKQ